MEIDISEVKFKGNTVLWTFSGLLALVLLGALGRFVLPDRVLTWTEWSIVKQHAAYRREVGVLERHAERLEALLKDSPDPVRAQLTVEQLYAALDRDVTLEPLFGPKDALLTAGDLALEWALGSAEKKDADLALELARKDIETAAERTYER